MNSVKINIDYDIESIKVKPGEYITVYMFNSKGNTVQVELRVLPNGEPQIFLDNMNIIKDFEAWTKA